MGKLQRQTSQLSKSAHEQREYDPRLDPNNPRFDPRAAHDPRNKMQNMGRQQRKDFNFQIGRKLNGDPQNPKIS